LYIYFRVAVRVRPISEKEDDNLVNFVPHQPQIIIGHDRHFTFDYVFSPVITQSQVYHSCIEPLFEQYVKGYILCKASFFSAVVKENLLLIFISALKKDTMPQF
jgi:hypothetical protein